MQAIDNGLVSVVIPTFNRGKLVLEAVRSALDQTYSPLEIIVVDDGSNDGTADALSQLVSEGRIRYIRKENGGAASARNLGIREARGKWVAFLDSDDTWTRWKTALQVMVMQKYPDVGLVFTDFSASAGTREYESYLKEYYSIFRRLGLKYTDVFDNSSIEEWMFDGEKALRKIPLYYGNVFKVIFQGNFIPTATVLARKDFLIEIGGMDESFRTGEDSDMYLRFCRQYPVAFIDISTMHYSTVSEDRLSGDSYLLLLQENAYRSILNVASSSPDFCRENSRMVRERLSLKSYEIGRLLLGRGQKTRSRKMFLESLGHDPSNWVSALGYVATFIPGMNPMGLIRKIKRVAAKKGD